MCQPIHPEDILNFCLIQIINVPPRNIEGYRAAVGQPITDAKAVKLNVIFNKTACLFLRNGAVKIKIIGVCRLCRVVVGVRSNEMVAQRSSTYRPVLLQGRERNLPNGSIIGPIVGPL